MTEYGELFTWGCGTDGQLGHTSRVDTPRTKTKHVSPPAMVTALMGQAISLISCASKSMICFVPTSLESLEPQSGPMTGKTSLKIDGAGFWDSEDIIVRFTSLNENFPPRGAPGVYHSSSKTVTCLTPIFGTEGPVQVDVAMDGRNFTKTKLNFMYYSGEDLEAEVAPAFCGARGGSQIALNKCSGLNMNMRVIKIKFIPENSEAPEIVVPAYVTESETEEMDENGSPVISKGLVCTSPCYTSEKWKLPLVAKIYVALNGVDFMPVKFASITFAEAHIDRISPTCGPLGKSTTIILKGSSFINNGKGKVKFSYKNGNLDMASATFVNPETMKVSVPILSIESGNECASLAVSFDDENWATGSNETCFTYYGNLPRASSKPVSGPSTGGTKVTCFVPFDKFFQPKMKLSRNGAKDIVIALTQGDLVTRTIAIEETNEDSREIDGEDATKTDDAEDVSAGEQAKPNAISGYELFFQTPEVDISSSGTFTSCF